MCDAIHPIHGPCNKEHDPDLERELPFLADDHLRRTVAGDFATTWVWRADGEVYGFERCAVCQANLWFRSVTGETLDHSAQHARRHEVVMRHRRIWDEFEEERWGEWLAMWGGIGEVAAVQLDDQARGLVA